MNIFNWFKKPKKQHEEEQDEEFASINVAIDNNLTPIITCKWNSDSIEIAQAYGEMLHQLNSGHYVETIINILTSSIQDDITNQQFISETTKSWRESYEEEEKQEQNIPLIHPMQTFGASNRNE